MFPDSEFIEWRISALLDEALNLPEGSDEQLRIEALAYRLRGDSGGDFTFPSLPV